MQTVDKQKMVEQARRLMEEDGLSVRGAAKRLGVGRSTLAAWLAGPDREAAEHDRMETLAQEVRNEGGEATAHFLEHSRRWVVRVVKGDELSDLASADDVRWFLAESQTVAG